MRGIGPAALLLAVLVAGCNQQPALVPPPPNPVVVATPLRQELVDYATFTGQTSPVQSVDLMARVPGYLRKVEFVDGTDVEDGKELFLIEPEPYQAQVELAQATVEQHQAQLKANEAEFERQQTLQQQSVSTQANYDRALANRDAERAAVAEAQANLTTAQINLSYTKVLAPFSGRIGRRLVDPGNLVGQGAPTKLATIQDIGQIYVYFTAAEPDVLRFRKAMAQEGMTRETLSRIPVEAGLQDDKGYPYKGRLDFADTGIDTTTGTLQVRAVIDNADKRLIPGLFTRLRIPLGPPAPALVLPETAFGIDQVGSYVMAVDKDDVVSLRRVTTGPARDGLRVVTSGVAPEDRIVIEGIQNAAPGRKVAVRPGTVAAPAAP
jgi:RND family efflux transporter MFP subunit